MQIIQNLFTKIYYYISLSVARSLFFVEMENIPSLSYDICHLASPNVKKKYLLNDSAFMPYQFHHFNLTMDR